MRKRTSLSQPRSKPLRAYISAPPDVDTTPLRRVLRAENVTVEDASSLAVREPLVETILKSVRSADLAVAVIAPGACDTFGGHNTDFFKRTFMKICIM